LKNQQASLNRLGMYRTIRAWIRDELAMEG